jgi:hypothetical protein
MVEGGVVLEGARARESRRRGGLVCLRSTLSTLDFGVKGRLIATAPWALRLAEPHQGWGRRRVSGTVNVDEQRLGHQRNTESLSWTRPSSCGTGGSVEVAFEGDAVTMRDGKDPDGTVLRFTDGEWAAFIAGVNAGEFDAPRGCVG